MEWNLRIWLRHGLRRGWKRHDHVEERLQREQERIQSSEASGNLLTLFPEKLTGPRLSVAERCLFFYPDRMKKNALLWMSLSLSATAMANTTVSVTPAPSATATVAATPAAVAPAATPASLTDAEKKKLLLEFKKALGSQKVALAHQEKSAMKELNASQAAKQKKWREDQKKARQQFFDQHQNGPERREYVQTYIKNKEEFETSLKVEYANAKKSWAEKSVALKESQKDLEAKFKAALASGVRPGPELWPTAH